MNFRTIAAIAILVLAAPALAKTYTNELFGITIERPDKWHTISTAEAMSNAQQIKADPAYLEKAIAEFGQSSIFVFMKYPTSHPGVIPTLKLGVHSTKGAGQITDTQIAEIVGKELNGAFSGFEWVEMPSASRVGNVAAARFVTRFDIPAQGRIFRITTCAWIIKRDTHFFLLATSFEKEKDGQELEQIANTLVMKD